VKIDQKHAKSHQSEKNELNFSGLKSLSHPLVKNNNKTNQKHESQVQRIVSRGRQIFAHIE
jgi:hypothetical protein